MEVLALIASRGSTDLRLSAADASIGQAPEAAFPGNLILPYRTHNYKKKLRLACENFSIAGASD